jgi:hypothetical protein
MTNLKFWRKQAIECPCEYHQHELREHEEVDARIRAALKTKRSKVHLEHPETWGAKDPRAWCGVKSEAVVEDEDYVPEGYELCGRCARLAYKGWRDTMDDIFEHGGSDSEREIFEPMGIGKWN